MDIDGMIKGGQNMNTKDIDKLIKQAETKNKKEIKNIAKKMLISKQIGTV
jgi:hypothetical protein